MNRKKSYECQRRSRMTVRALRIALLCMAGAGAYGQNAAGKPDSAAAEASDGKPAALSLSASPEERSHEAWSLLSDAAADTKHPQTRIQALAAIGLMANARSEKMITDAMKDPDVDVRTAAALAAGQGKNRDLNANLRDLLDDKEPQVAFTAAMTLWKMGDRSGEDILMAVVDGDRSAGPTMMHGTQHKISRDLHDPAMLARVGAMQGAYMLLGPFGYGITAYEYIHKSGGDLARVSAIEQISQQKTEPIHKKLLDALADKDQAVRAAALKALAEYRGPETSMKVYGLMADDKYPVRLTAAAAYLRTTGVPGPTPAAPPASSRTNIQHTPKPAVVPKSP